MSWANPNPIRRRFIDSSINEGIGFYVEELLLQAGLFDFSPRSREIIYSLCRLRALRVEIDIRLAVGDFTIEQAAEYLARAVPMDRETALEEAVFFAFNPGQAISYQIGKLQILDFLADAKLDQGEEFSLRHFHDFLMQNGNVPDRLQRWEYLGREDEVLRLDALGGKPVTVPSIEQKPGHEVDRALKSWSGKRDSNSRPQPWQGCALPTELFPQRVRIVSETA